MSTMNRRRRDWTQGRSESRTNHSVPRQVISCLNRSRFPANNEEPCSDGVPYKTALHGRSLTASSTGNYIRQKSHDHLRSVQVELSTGSI